MKKWIQATGIALCVVGIGVLVSMTPAIIGLAVLVTLMFILVVALIRLML